MKTKLQSKPVNSNRYTVQYHEQRSPEHHKMTCITQGKPMKYSSTLSFKNNHVTTSSTISWTRIAHLQDFLVNLLPRVQAIDCCFYFPTHLFLHLLYLGKLSMKQNHERFAKTCDSDKKNYICQSGTAQEDCWVNCPTKVGNLKASTVCWRESTKRVQVAGNQAAVDRVQRVAVEDLMLSQEDKPKKCRSAREISYETAILCSSVHRIIHQLECFKRLVLSCCLKPIASPASLADKQPYRL